MNIEERLRGAGLRQTRARAAVLGCLRQADRPLTHQEVAAHVRRIDRVTLYRTLTTLQDAGLIHRVQGVDGAWRFGCHNAAEARCPGNHVHFLCLACRQMQCLQEEPLPWVSVPRGTEVAGKQLVVYGRCRECALDG